MNAKIKGVDIFLVQKDIPKISKLSSPLQLKSIFNRGTQVYPGPDPVCHLTDVHQCHFECAEETATNLVEIQELLAELGKQGFHWCEVHNIYDF